MAKIGNIEEFKLQQEEDFETWVERLELYMLVNKIKENKAAIFLTLIGSEGYKVLKSLCTPELPKDVEYEKLVSNMKDYLQPKVSILAERSKFRNCLQENNETITEFMTKLQKLSILCGFGNNLEEALRDQIVHGVSDRMLKKKLCEEPNLTYGRTKEICQAHEGAEKSLENFQQATKGDLNFIKKKASNKWKEPNWKNGKNGDNADGTCTCCGNMNHVFGNCYFKNRNCEICNKKGHLKKVCYFNKNKTDKVQSKFSDEKNKNHNKSNFGTRNKKVFKNKINKSNHFLESDNLDIDTLFQIEVVNKKNNNITIKVQIENEIIDMQLDTGSAISAISLSDYENNFNYLTIVKTNLNLRSYSGDSITPIGLINVKVKFNEKDYDLKLYIVENGGPPLLGNDWLKYLGIKVNIDFEMNNITSQNHSNQIKELITKFPEVFTDKLGTYNKNKCKLYLKENFKPIFFKPRSLPYKIKDQVGAELDRLVKEGILTPVETCDFGTPIVPVIKANGSIRICGDYKVTINPYLKVDRYPLPRIEDLFSNISGSVIWSKIDLSQAYTQLLVEENSKEILTLSTHQGLYVPNRLMYGIASAPGIFQREMENLFRKIDNVVCFLDDILIHSDSVASHINKLNEVFNKLKECGLTVREEKCAFFQDEIQYLGYKINKHGLNTSETKIKAIVDAPIPTNITQVKSFLGMVNYYFKFIKNSTEILYPLYNLLKKDNEFNWNKKCDNAFNEIKKILTSAPILTHFNQNYKIKLSCDASSYGIGGVISHILPNNEERPIAYTSRTLNLAEQKYSQIDKEALAIVFCIKKFHQYLYGRHFILLTDHKPLTYIFHEKKSLPQVAANRIQRYALFLANYDYSIQYVKSENNQSADALSRLAITHTNDREMDVSTIHFVNDYFQGINKNMIQKETEQDEVLKVIKKYILTGWPNAKVKIIQEPIRSYYLQKHELTVEQNCIFLGHRLVVPKCLQEIFLNELHSTHFGVVKLKMMVRNYFWWPQLNKHIDQLVASCSTCIKFRKEPTKSSLHVWEYPNEPGERIHADFLELNKKMFIVIIDEFSKWPEVIPMTSTTALNTINVMREFFSRYGICQTFVTDNGPQWTSKEFQIFIKNNCIKHILTPPYHPQSNGAAENMVDYRNTIHCTTGKSPAELHMNRKLNSKFDLIIKQFNKEPYINNNLDVKTKVELSQNKTKKIFGGKRNVNFKIGDTVLARNYSKGQKWITGKIKEKVGKVIFIVDSECGQIKRHIDQLLLHKLKERDVSEEKVDINDSMEVRRSKRHINKPKKFL
ncbi:unnamed protein product [Macrosiphum euphorbiae]|uniref:RNA-directed DNA polymerase n=1 Tax=Macrosiphum euphorbiae TaxID=13131 RepID=A0AAV0WE97_9HEMI|nr:unnamed protein product [Macrosiphum euphorbiae]CAI6357731.1 unnamed protein product [Macrosiphum euphorbiae]CAI6358805.1 unnamed protein product [Macrosiphum euphorbiae]